MEINDLTFENRDEFSREIFAKRINKLIKSSIATSPMVIDGGWGTGKSEFCHKLMNLMEDNDTHHLIYIDAFKADHADEPLMTVLAEVIKVLPEDKVKTFKEKALPAARFGLKTVAKAAVGHILRKDVADFVDDFDKEIQQATDKAIDATVESLLNDHIQAEKNLLALQESLLEIARERPIVIFVDELDRCKPTFSIDMLEIIKHTFDVEGVEFVLITNTEQLKASINHSYGNNVDSQRYLDKFVKFTFKLPVTCSFDGDEYYFASAAHFRYLTQKSTILKESSLDSDGFMEIVNHLARVNKFSLREVETLVRHLEVYRVVTDDQAFSEDESFGLSLLKLFAVMIFTFKTSLADQFLEHRTDAKHIGEYLGVSAIDWGHAVPDQKNTLAVMLGMECTYNSEMFTSAMAQPDVNWIRVISDYFTNNKQLPAPESKSEIVEQALRGMALNH